MGVKRTTNIKLPLNQQPLNLSVLQLAAHRLCRGRVRGRDRKLIVLSHSTKLADGTVLRKLYLKSHVRVSLQDSVVHRSVAAVLIASLVFKVNTFG